MIAMMMMMRRRRRISNECLLSAHDAAVGIERAVIIVGSQKTLPVAVAVISSMGASLGPIAGLAVIPCIICHLMQIIADSFLVSYWLKRSRTSAAGAPA